MTGPKLVCSACQIVEVGLGSPVCGGCLASMGGSAPTAPQAVQPTDDEVESLPVAHLRSITHPDWLELCDRDAPGAFPVYAAPPSKPEAPAAPEHIAALLDDLIKVSECVGAAGVLSPVPLSLTVKQIGAYGELRAALSTPPSHPENEDTELLDLLKQAHGVIDCLFARCISLDPEFRPTTSGHWPVMVAISDALRAAKAKED